MKRPQPTNGLNHVAFYVKNMEACEKFYTELLGMRIDWHPDADNLYLTSGKDNLAFHRAPEKFSPAQFQRLDHIGFALKARQDVDEWHDFLLAQNVIIKAAPKDHRDGTRSFYFADPEGNVVQMIYFPES
jgi:catechol 2,3-dioxygenase-like lactoylglutathione lyase family enzyme